MWNTLKILFCALVVLLFCVPIVARLVKIARYIGGLIHEWKLDRATRKIAWAKVAQEQITRYGPDERGFGGLVHDDANNLWHNLDTGERWTDDGRPIGRTDRSRRTVSDEQRLLAAAGRGGRQSKPATPPVAVTGGVQVEQDTALNEPARHVERDNVQR